MLESFFILGGLPPNIEYGFYQPPLVILSYLVASFASYTALALAQELTGTLTIRERYVFHIGGAIAMGAGIWAMHFIGMLSYKMRMVVEYDPALTLLSMLIAIIVSYLALGIVARNQLTIRQILMGGILLGFGICSMHYVGMASMQMDGDLRYRPFVFLLSLVIAIAASAAALWIAFTLSRNSSRYQYLYRVGAAMVMGAAICGMHYTGMAAAVFIPYADCRYDPNQDFHGLAIGVAIVTCIILCMALTVGLYRRAQIESKLLNSENKLRAIIESALDAVVAMDQDGKITEWNNQAEVIFGWPREEAIGKQMAEMIIPPEYREMHYQGLRRFLRDGVGPILNKRIEIQAMNRYGKFFSAELTVTAQKLHNNYSFTAFIRNITERKKSEEAVSLLASIVASSDDAIISKTLDGIITSWNAAAERLYGYSAEEVLGQHISIILPRERMAEEKQIMERLLTGLSTDHFETIRIAKDGRPIDVSLTVSPVRDNAGKIVGASKVARDITARKEVEAQLQRYMKALERSNQDLEDFAHIASHDLREPLRGLHNHASFLIEDYRDKLGEDGVRRLERLSYLSQRMERLITDLLYFSQIGRSELAVQTTDPNAIIEEVRQMQETFLNERNARIIVPELLPPIVCDKTRVTEVFRNLITNAVKYNDKPEKLVEVGFIAEMDTPEGPEKNIFYVKDNGIGIEEEFYQQIFRIFKRLNRSPDDKETGTGVGLTFVKKIVERHQGRIWLESEPGKGTTFYFNLNRGA